MRLLTEMRPVRYLCGAAFAASFFLACLIPLQAHAVTGADDYWSADQTFAAILALVPRMDKLATVPADPSVHRERDVPFAGLSRPALVVHASSLAMRGKSGIGYVGEMALSANDALLAAAGNTVDSFLGWFASVWRPQLNGAEPAATTSKKVATAETTSPLHNTPDLAKASTSPTIINNYPVIERIIERALPAYGIAKGGGITEDILSKELTALESRISARISMASAVNSSQLTTVYQTVGQMGKIESLDGTRLSNITVDGVTGLTAADIPTSVVASSYLPLAGGTMTGVFNSTWASTSTFDGNVHVKGQIKVGLNSAYLSDTGLQAGGSFVISTTDENAALSLQSLGRVGVSSSTPWGVLSVEHNGANASMPVFVAASSSEPNPYFLIDYEGRVGIGTSSPVETFSINGATYLADISAPAATGNRLYANSGSLYWAGNIIGGGGIGTWTSNGSNVYRASGNVGIGTTSPSEKLHVYSDATGSTKIGLLGGSAGSAGIEFLYNTTAYGKILGNATDNAFRIEATYSNSNPIEFFAGGSERVRITSAGNVGIGTTSPYSLLSISNSASTAANTPLFSIASTTAGTATTTLMTVLANGNVGIGTIGTLASRLDITNSATSSAIITLRDPIGGVSLEFRAGTSTLLNTFAGISAGKENTTGSNNTAFGYQALRSNTTGTDNNAFGYRSLEFNTTGLGNTAIGRFSLFNSATGNFNTGLGYQSLTTNTSGSSNTAIGKNPLYFTTTGSFNTAIGESPLQSNTTGSFNIGLGYKAGFNITTGYDNIFLGHDENTGGNAITTGFNNIGLGYNIKFPATTTSNMLNIGNFLFANLPATTTTTTIDNTPLTGKLGVGTSTPYAKLTIWGGDTLATSRALEVANSASTTLFTIMNGGNVGIGTTTPWRTLSVTGTVGFDGLTATSTVGNDLCLSNLNEVTLRTGANCAGSSVRFKENVQPLTAASGLQAIVALNPVSFSYKSSYLGGFVSDPNWTSERVGFIAEEVQRVDPRLTTSDPDGTPNNVRYELLTSLITKAVQEIAGISGLFKDKLVAWLGDATNGVGDFFANRVRTTVLCVAKSDGTDVCVTGDQLSAAIFGSSAAPISANSTGAPPPDTSFDLAQDEEAPVLTLNGVNPTSIRVGDTYADMGAEATDNVDPTLYIYARVDDGPVQEPRTMVTVDTSVAASHTIVFSVTDTAGNTASVSRTVEVTYPDTSAPPAPEPVSEPEAPPTTITDTTPATSAPGE